MATENIYQRGQIYAIRSHQTELIYIGSTVQPLSKRFGGHKLPSNNLSSREIMKYADAYIELIEDYPCNSKKELNRKEGKWIRQMDCVNKTVAGRTQQEWIEENKEELKTYKKQYYEKNKEKLIARQKQYQAEHKEEIVIKNKQRYVAKKLLTQNNLEATQESVGNEQ